MAVGDLTTLANVKQYSAITIATDDQLLTRLISALSTFIQTWLNRTIASASYTDVINGIDSQRVQFANYPVTAVASLTIDGIAVPAAPVPITAYWTGYVFDTQQIMVQGYRFTRGFQNISIAYTAGFATTPLDIEQACLEIIDLRYKQRSQTGFISKSIAGETVTFDKKDMSASTLTLLQNYRRVAPPV
jgi:Phage gp6-like head-tail connector protein